MSCTVNFEKISQEIDDSNIDGQIFKFFTADGVFDTGRLIISSEDNNTKLYKFTGKYLLLKDTILGLIAFLIYHKFIPKLF